jgi:hypothetical protein
MRRTTRDPWSSLLKDAAVMYALFAAIVFILPGTGRAQQPVSPRCLTGCFNGL